MPNYIESRWDEFSQKFCKFNGLAPGSFLRMEPKSGSGRPKRSDFVVRRVAINSKNILRLNDDDKVKTLISQVTNDVLEHGAVPRGMCIKLYDARGKEIDPRTHLGNLRPNKDRAADRQISESNFEEIEYLTPIARMAIGQLEDGISEPDVVVVGAVLRHLMERYTPDQVKAVMKEL